MVDRITNDKPNSLNVCWEPTSTCNYSCWYCPEELHDGKYRWPDLDTALSFFKNIAAKRDTVHIDMVGGEPTLWPDIDEFLDKKPDNVHVEISSNGARTVRWWRQNFSKMAGATLTFHPNSADPDHFYDLCEALHDMDKELHVFIMAVKSKIDVCQSLFTRLKESGFKISVSTKMLDVRHDDARMPIAEINSDADIVHLLKTNRFNRRKHGKYVSKPNISYLNGEEFDHLLAPLHKKNLFKGWTCWAGVTRLYIKPNGDIYRGSCRNGGVIGNINNNLDILDIKPEICQLAQCNCIDEILIEKHYPLNENES